MPIEELGARILEIKAEYAAFACVGPVGDLLDEIERLASEALAREVRDA